MLHKTQDGKYDPCTNFANQTLFFTDDTGAIRAIGGRTELALWPAPVNLVENVFFKLCIFGNMMAEPLKALPESYNCNRTHWTIWRR